MRIYAIVQSRIICSPHVELESDRSDASFAISSRAVAFRLGVKRITPALTIALLTILGILVEQELLAQLVSPEVHVDRRVTFRLRAPNATEVRLEGIAGLESQAMSKDADGIWELTVGPLPPELYSYSFEVDGAAMIDPHNRNVKKWLSLNSMVLVPGDPPLLHEQRKVLHGVVHRHVYGSNATGADRGVYVYTPPDYSSNPTEHFPLVLLLHGYGDDESAWLEVGCAHRIADNLLSQGEIEPLVIAMPYGHPLPIERKSRFDEYASRNVQAMEQDLLQDLLPYLANEYRLKKGREHRAIVGLSMGGGQALTIGLGHLDRFGWVGGFSSATPQGDLEQRFADLLDDVSATNTRLNLLWSGCGQEDLLVERNQQFTTWLSDHDIRHTYRLTEGGHDWIVWRQYLAEFLPLLFR